MIQYILNGKSSVGTVTSHIEDYRTKEQMEKELARIIKVCKNNPFLEVYDVQERRFKVKCKNTDLGFEYYITEREV